MSLCKSISNIADALNTSNVGGAEQSKALNLRLTEQYLDAMNTIYEKTSVLMLPESSDNKC